MNRVKSGGYSAAIEAALQIIPEPLRFLTPDFLCGVDPVFAGLHRYTDTRDGRSYRDTAHCVYECHQSHLPRSQRRVTIVLPDVAEPWVIVHEFGHVLHDHINYEHVATPVTLYAKVNEYEAFAEAFSAWLMRDSSYFHADAIDEATRNLFEELAVA